MCVFLFVISLFAQCVIKMLEMNKKIIENKQKKKSVPDHLVCSPDCSHAGWSAEGGSTGRARLTHLAGSGKESLR